MSTDGEKNRACAGREVTGRDVCEVLFDKVFAASQCSGGRRNLNSDHNATGIRYPLTEPDYGKLEWTNSGNLCR